MTKTPTEGRTLHSHTGWHAVMGPGSQGDGSSTDMRAGTRSWGRVVRTRLFRRLTLAPVLILPFLMLALACAAPQASGPYVPPESTAVPDIAATVAARDAALPQGGPAPTPVPEDVAQAASDFAQAHAALVQDWDRVRKDLDSWRQGLDSCSPAALQTSLRGFSADFRQVALAAQDLPRDPAVREMSARLIEAVENEGAALRRLRDGGDASLSMPQSDSSLEEESKENGEEESNGMENNAPPSPGFEGVAQARAESVAARKEVEDHLIDLQELTGEGSRSRVEAFSEALDELSSRWDRFHRDYDAFQSARPGLTPEDSLQRLDRLVDQHRDLVLAHRDLPVTLATQEAADILAQAVQDEDAALRRLRGSFQIPGDGDGAVPSTPSSASSSSAIGSTGSEDGRTAEDNQGEEGGNAMESAPEPGSEAGRPESAGVGPGDPGLFDAFDEQVVLTNSLRWKAALALGQAVSASSEDDRAAADSFASAYGTLLGRWQDFHAGYDRWLANEGGCDRASVAKDLGEFTLRMGDIAASARSLPQAPPLRPLGELTVEAAQREAEALRLFRDSWVPFDPSVYQVLDRELAATGILRRQAQLGLQDLLLRYAISPS